MKNSFKNKLITFILNEVIKKGIFRFLPDKQFIVFDYFIATKKLLNLKDPKTFSEKIQWIKLFGGLEKCTKYVDKYEVRDFISKTIGDNYLIPLLGVWDSFDEIDFEKLPRQFVLKATHGCDYVFICKDKATLDINSLKKTVTKWLNENFYTKTREIQYRNCTPRIICEKYLEDESGGLADYKIYCFNGKPKIIEVHVDRFINHRANYMDLNWEKLPIKCVLAPNSNTNLRKPRQLKAMLDIAKKLSKTFPFVRVDLYLVKKKIYFGELTFTPANGLISFNPPEANYQLGELIDLSRYNKNQIIK